MYVQYTYVCYVCVYIYIYTYIYIHITFTGHIRNLRHCKNNVFETRGDSPIRMLTHHRDPPVARFRLCVLSRTALFCSYIYIYIYVFLRLA